MKSYNGELPDHISAQIDEHSAGGFILFRIGSEGDILTDYDFDSEVSHLALVSKAKSILKAFSAFEDMKTENEVMMSDQDYGEIDLEEGEDYEDDKDED